MGKLILIINPFRIKSMKPKKRKDSLSNLNKPDALTDQSMGVNHFNQLRGARGSVAHVYYAPQNAPNPQVLNFYN